METLQEMQGASTDAPPVTMIALPQTLREQLQARKAHLQVEFTKVDDALTELNRNPETERVYLLVMQALYGP